MIALAPTPRKIAARRRWPRVAIKIQRRKYARDGLKEVAFHRSLNRQEASANYIINLFDAFIHDDHVCQVYELHGTETGVLLKGKSLAIPEVKLIAGQLLQTLGFLHRAGWIHTDIKPRNLLWCDRSKEIRLIDFDNSRSHLRTGQAVATWSYSPPEMLIGNPMNWAIDIWALGCTIFELLTGKALFDPWGICRRKYAEFSSSHSDFGTSGNEDEFEEKAEEFEAGYELKEKYRLVRSLGRGRCCMTWEAELLSAAVRNSIDLPEEQILKLDRTYRKPRPPKKGHNIYTVAVNYEHFVAIQQRLGVFPDHLANEGMFRDIYYDCNGLLHFDREIPRTTIRGLLLSSNFQIVDATQIEAFLLPMLRLDPATRPPASELLQSDWLRN
jgi:serine/threonine protein kinase